MKLQFLHGTTYARFSLFDEFVNPASDLDLYVFNSAGTQIGGSGSGTSDEEVNLMNPAAGTYYVMVDGYATANPSTYTLFTWFLGSADAGNMTVSAPASAVIGQTGTIDLTFSPVWLLVPNTWVASFMVVSLVCPTQPLYVSIHKNLDQFLNICGLYCITVKSAFFYSNHRRFSGKIRKLIKFP